MAKKVKPTKKDKKYIRSNINNLSIEEIAARTNLDKKIVENYAKRKKIRHTVSKKGTFEPYTNYSSTKELSTFLLKHIDFFVLLGLIVFGVYLNSLNGGFISDDIPGYVNNPLTHNLSKAIETRNIHRIIHAINYYFFKLNPIPSHITSVVLHLLCGILAFTFFSKFFPKKIVMPATILAMVHPINSEAVSWISGRVYLIICAYTFVTLIFYLLYRSNRKLLYLVLSSIVFAVAVVTTNMAQILIIPPILIITDFFLVDKRVEIKKLFRFAPHAIVALIFVITLATRISTRAESVKASSTKSTPYIYTIAYSEISSLKLMLFPKNLTLYHEGETISKPEFFLAIIIFLGFVILTPVLIKKDRKIFGLLAFSIASILYMLSPIQVSWFIAERYLYLASFCFCLIVTILLYRAEKVTKIKSLAAGLLVLISITYSIRTIVRNNDWQTRRSLWEATQKISPNSKRAYNNLGDVYAKEGNLEKAAEFFKKSTEVAPEYAAAYHNLGYTYLLMKNFPLAEENFLKSIELQPDITNANYHLGLIEIERTNYGKAIEYMEKELALSPDDPRPKRAIRSIHEQYK